MAIFSHVDNDGDSLEAVVQSTEILEVSVARGDTGRSYSAYLNRDAALRLRDALNDWLGSPASDITPEPVYPADSLYGQLIRKAVAEEVARVLPLHLAPMARCRRCGVSANEPHTDCAGDERACVYIRPGDAGYDLLADPEPHDVGHPTYEDARPLVRVGPSHCGECTHSMNDHTWVGGCWGNAGTCTCEVQQDAPVLVVKSDKVWGEQGAPPEPVALRCICIHETEYPHRPEYNGCTYTGCLCKYVPSAPPVHCTCDKHNHRPAVRGTSTACVTMGCGCRYRGAS